MQPNARTRTLIPRRCQGPLNIGECRVRCTVRAHVNKRGLASQVFLRFRGRPRARVFRTNRVPRSTLAARHRLGGIADDACRGGEMVSCSACDPLCCNDVSRRRFSREFNKRDYYSRSSRRVYLNCLSRFLGNQHLLMRYRRSLKLTL